MDWITPEIKRILNKHNTPVKIQAYITELKYNKRDTARSPRFVFQTQKAHCLEGALLGAFMLEYHGYEPMLLDFQAHRDDDHVVALFKENGRWGALGKTNTVLLAYRSPVYKSVREIAMSYFDFYFNFRGRYSFHSFSKPISLKKYDKFDWRGSKDDLMFLSEHINREPHERVIGISELEKFDCVSKKVKFACFYPSEKL
jgi:hypothetical protein